MAAVAAANRLGLAVSSGYHTNFQAYSRHYHLGWLHGLVSAHLRRLHNQTNLTLVPTREMARRLSADGYRNVDVLARGVDSRIFNPRHRSIALRRSWAAAEDTLVVAYVGRLAPEKNLPLVTRTFETIRVRNPAARMLFVGDGPSLASLRRQHPDYIFAGLRRDADLAAHYASADLFLFPSLTETYGNVIPEALASGLGVVAFECAAAADLIQDGINGRTVASTDANAFVKAGVALANDRQRLAVLRTKGASSVAGLDWEHIHDQFVHKLLTLLARHRLRQETFKISRRGTPAARDDSSSVGSNGNSTERKSA
jgi:glycosyltransferase involved in cell wall biosynthesis